MDTFDIAFDLASRRGDDFRIKSIEAWYMGQEDCDYHWIIAYSHPTGGTTSVSREMNVLPKWITGIPREKAIAAIRFPTTDRCPDLRRLALRVFCLEEHPYRCTSFVYALLKDYKDHGYIEDPENQVGNLSSRMTREKVLSTFHIPDHLRQFHARLSNVKIQSDLKVGLLILWKSHVLLVKRLESDSHRSIWECPGGVIEQSDKSILDGAARECRKGTQLHISTFIVYLHEQWVEGNRQVNKYTFIVDVHESKDPEELLTRVVLNPAEYQQSWWATRREIESMNEALFSPNLKTNILSVFDCMEDHN